MAVSKRLRFEVLRRDNHACRYCGAAAPAVTLEVDHVVPRALGGRDEGSNLVTACEPCNSGKSATAPDQRIVDDVAQDALRWARAMQHALDVLGVSDDLIASAMRTALAHTKLDHVDRWRYMCGICWREVDAARDAATRRLAAPIAEPASVPKLAEWSEFSDGDLPDELMQMREVFAPNDHELDLYGKNVARLTDISTWYWTAVHGPDPVHRAWSSCFRRDHLSRLAWRARLMPGVIDRAIVTQLVSAGAVDELCARCCGPERAQAEAMTHA